MTPLSRIHLPSGARIVLDPKVDRGGEETVYEVVISSDLVARTYSDGPAKDRREKIVGMVVARPDRQGSQVSTVCTSFLSTKTTVSASRRNPCLTVQDDVLFQRYRIC